MESNEEFSMTPEMLDFSWNADVDQSVPPGLHWPSDPNLEHTNASSENSASQSSESPSNTSSHPSEAELPSILLASPNPAVLPQQALQQDPRRRSGETPPPFMSPSPSSPGGESAGERALRPREESHVSDAVATPLTPDKATTTSAKSPTPSSSAAATSAATPAAVSRRSHAKSRTGCRTCKRRKIKVCVPPGPRTVPTADSC